MYQNKTFLAVMPVRGGSKGLPRKNILPFLGQPLLVHSFNEAKKSKYLDRIVISTEDKEITMIAQQAGAEVIDRPPALAEDSSPTEDCLIQVIDYLKEKESKEYDYIVTLQVTSPLRTAQFIDQGIELILSDNFDSLISCTAINKKFGQKVNNEFKPLFPNQPRRRQDRQPLYGSNGVLYITKTEVLIRDKHCTSGTIACLETPEDLAADIDEMLDFKIAETIYKYKYENS